MTKQEEHALTDNQFIALFDYFLEEFDENEDIDMGLFNLWIGRITVEFALSLLPTTGE